MKKFFSILLVLSMLLSLVSVAFADGEEYIAAPYDPAQVDPTVTYLEPAFYENENGPVIGVTTVGVIVKDGKYYKDMDNDHELDAFENWELSAEERAADLVTKMTLAEQAGFVMNALLVTPVVPKLDMVKNEDGSINPAKVMTIIPEGEQTQNLQMYNPTAAYFAASDDQVLTDGNIRAGVYRGGLNFDASVVALYTNIATAICEWDSAKDGTPAIPYTLISNPISAGFPDSLGMAAAVIADSDLENGVIDASAVKAYAEVDREMWRAQGLTFVYGPQIDLVTDPRWPRNSGTYGERETVVAAIIDALVDGYQNGKDGANAKSVVLSAKHFPGDGASENGFESHTTQGQWRLYPTDGSLQYQLAGFQAACDAGVGAIMPCYSRDTADARSVAQTYTNPSTGASMEVVPEELGSAYNKTVITDLLRGVMGFNGFIQSDSGITQQQCYGAEALSQVERFAALISAGTDAIGGELAPEAIVEAVESGLLPKEDLDRANINRATQLFKQGMFDNNYLDYLAADEVRATNMSSATEQAYQMHLKATVLMKNSNGALPLAANAGTKLYIASCTKDGMEADSENATVAAMAALFEAQGFVITDDYKEAEVAYLYVEPSPTNSTSAGASEGVLGLVEDYAVPERDMSGEVSDSAIAAIIGGNGATNKRIGSEIEVTTLADVNKIAKVADAVHANGGKVVASIVITSPWILTNLEPYCDALLAQYTATNNGNVSSGSLGMSQKAQVAVITGEFNPCGGLSVTMVSDESVIALTDGVELADGTIAEICASPNDMPGYLKDQYISADVLAGVKGGSYAYQDADGNYYVSGFGLSY